MGKTSHIVADAGPADKTDETRPSCCRPQRPGNAMEVESAADVVKTRADNILNCSRFSPAKKKASQGQALDVTNYGDSTAPFFY
ncbi:hypothetical protein SAMN05444162_0963 [Paenibacillaceae bacterium GAS479]|nr:hypothetical protein SAMN05444162_0963 [Paenibacillaceae bacterium GAS479]